MATTYNRRAHTSVDIIRGVYCILMGNSFSVIESLHLKSRLYCVLTLQSVGGQFDCQLLTDGQPALQDVQLELEEELVTGDFFRQSTRIGGVELHSQVQRDGRNPSQLPANPFTRIQPMGLIRIVLETQSEVRRFGQIELFEDFVE